MKRTKPLPEGTTPKPPPPAEGGSSIFGGAKPVDTSAREKEIEARLAKRESELKSPSSEPKTEKEE
jgi:translation initiation factor 4B